MAQEKYVILAAILILAGSMLSTGVFTVNPLFKPDFGSSFEFTGYASASVTPICNQSNSVLKISSTNNAHAGFFNMSTYNLNVCYTNATGQVCNAPRSNIVLRLSAYDNAHAERKTSNTANYLDVCFGDLTCDYNANCTALGANYECLLSMSSDTNAHVGNCNAYPLKVCCAKAAAAPLPPPPPVCNDVDNDGLVGQPQPNACGTDLFPTDPCSKTTQGDNCMGQGCNTDANNDGIADLCQSSCTLFSAVWSKQVATEGELVTLTVAGSLACNNQLINFNIFEQDIGPDQDYSPDPPGARFSNGTATTTWRADWKGDESEGGNTDPEYYYIATNGSLQIQSGLLNVTRSTSLCGNNRIDAGETCVTCPDDAGCSSGNICCVNAGTATCSDTCSTVVDNGNNVCDTGENCKVNACLGKQDSCLQGLICGTDKLCGCNNVSDNICPNDDSCAAIDPDCDRDNDKLNDVNDNCPNVANPGQEDKDQDAVKPLCNYNVNPYLTDLGYLCGGDVCDYDDDNDGVCDAGEQSEYCTGSDICPNTPVGSKVDDDGCAQGENKCVAQWDCTNVKWDSCNEVTSLRTRDIGKCDSKQDAISGLCNCNTNAVTDECWQSTYRPLKEESCRYEEEFPVFTLWNVLLTTMLLTGYYMIRKLK